jgi:hypothetical protein
LDEKADDEKVDERKARFFILPLQIVVCIASSSSSSSS